MHEKDNYLKTAELSTEQNCLDAHCICGARGEFWLSFHDG